MAASWIVEVIDIGGDVRGPGRGSRGAVDPVARMERGTNQLQKPCILNRSSALRFLQPSVVTAVRNFEKAAQLPHLVALAMGFNELVDSPGSPGAELHRHRISLALS